MNAFQFFWKMTEYRPCPGCGQPTSVGFTGQPEPFPDPSPCCRCRCVAIEDALASQRQDLQPEGGQS